VAFRLRLNFSPALAALTGLFSVAVMIGVLVYGLTLPGLEGPELVRVSPEEGRPRGGGVGASGLNRPHSIIVTHSKIEGSSSP
jgi:hypothetical protein